MEGLLEMLLRKCVLESLIWHDICSENLANIG